MTKAQEHEIAHLRSELTKTKNQVLYWRAKTGFLRRKLYRIRDQLDKLLKIHSPGGKR